MIHIPESSCERLRHRPYLHGRASRQTRRVPAWDRIMKLTLVPSAPPDSDNDQNQFLTSYLINDTVAVDAGCLGAFLTPAEQARIRHIFLSHSHIDHIATLPVFIDNVNEMDGGGTTIYGSQAVLDCLRQDIFNDRVWPDYGKLPVPGDAFMTLVRLDAGRAVDVDNLRITPVPVNHVVPTFGFVIEDTNSAVIITSDTGPTEAIWSYANKTPNLKAIVLELTFPNSLAALAEASKHLTPDLFANEIKKLNRPVPVIAVHIKARFRAQVIKELESLGLANVQVGTFGVPYRL
jgi:ribonuclease BN (tRNA processing enzyme)